MVPAAEKQLATGGPSAHAHVALSCTAASSGARASSSSSSGGGMRSSGLFAVCLSNKRFCILKGRLRKKTILPLSTSSAGSFHFHSNNRSVGADRGAKAPEVHRSACSCNATRNGFSNYNIRSLAPVSSGARSACSASSSAGGG